ncbi:MAG TPA: carbohydrate ABC transporter permease [Sphaerochaetaceae bacterium]|jgi:raffinose/stachyose/melibiose transport system permease protein|nr:carbohydrate ABC transporter permease [Sphaerochaetaceae bacterium]
MTPYQGRDISVAGDINYFRRKRIQQGLVYVVLIIITLYTLAPLWFLFTNSFKGQAEIIRDPLGPPTSYSFEYIKNAIEQIHFFRSLAITFFITFFSVALIVLISSVGAWILVRNKTKWSQVIFMAFVAAMLIPFQAIMYPLIQFFDTLGLKNVYGLVFMYGGFGLSMSVFLYHGFVKGVPKGIEEAGIIDGCNIIQLFSHIVLPLLSSITVTVIVLNSMWIWNDYLLPFLVIGNSTTKTLVLELYFARILAGQFGNPWELIFPSVLVTIVPIVIIFLFLQKYIVKGITEGAIKS